MPLVTLLKQVDLLVGGLVNSAALWRKTNEFSRTIQVRSPGVNNSLFSQASTSVLPTRLCMLVLGVFTFDLVSQNVDSRETVYASQMQTPSADACYTVKSFPLEASMQK